MKIAMLGATDRFNYGDLLFPLIVKKSLLLRNPDFIVDNFATTDSDLSSIGALPTQKISRIYHKQYDAVIVVGGEVISAYWKMTYLHIQKSTKFALFLRIVFKLLGDSFSDRIIKNR